MLPQRLQRILEQFAGVREVSVSRSGSLRTAHTGSGSSNYDGEIIDPHVHIVSVKDVDYHWSRSPNVPDGHAYLPVCSGNVFESVIFGAGAALCQCDQTQNREVGAHRSQPVSACVSCADCFFLRSCAGSVCGVQEAKFEAVSIARCGKRPYNVSHKVVSASDRLRRPNAIIAAANLCASLSELELHLRALSAIPGVRGVRQILCRHPSRHFPLFSAPFDYIRDRDWLAGFALLEKYDFLFEIMVIAAEQLDETLSLVRSFPGVLFVLDHGGSPVDRDARNLERWKRAMAELGTLPNMVCKLSGFAMYERTWTKEQLRDYISVLLHAFGVDRCMFASNFSVDKDVRRQPDAVKGQTQQSALDELYSAFKSIASDLRLSHEDQKKLFHDNAMRVYRL